MKKGFQIKTANNILISSFNTSSGESKGFTFNENLTINLNDFYELSFSFSSEIPEVGINPIKILKIGSKLKLIIDENENNVIELIINSISPEIKNKRIVYNANAIDYASYTFTKNNVGLNLNTFEDIDFLEKTEDKTSNIFTIGSYILMRGNLTPDREFENQYTLEQEINFNSFLTKVDGKLSGILKYTKGIDTEEFDLGPTSLPFSGAFPNGIQFRIFIDNSILRYQIFSQGAELDLENGSYEYNIEQISKESEPEILGWKINRDDIRLIFQNLNLEVSSSNTYNALVELAKVSNSFLKFNYADKEIKFVSKNDVSFIKNYKLTLESNLEDISTSFSLDEFYPILYVLGGEDEFGIAVSMIPEVPETVFDFFRNWDSPNNEITISNSNSFYTNAYYGDSGWKEKVDAAGELEEKKVLDFIRIADQLPYLDSFIFNLNYFLENNIISEQDYDEIWDKIYNDLRKINYSFQYWTKRKYQIEWEINKRIIDLLNISEQVVKDTEFNTFIERMRSLKEILLTETSTGDQNVIIGTFEVGTNHTIVDMPASREWVRPRTLLIDGIGSITLNGTTWKGSSGSTEYWLENFSADSNGFLTYNIKKRDQITITETTTSWVSISFVSNPTFTISNTFDNMTLEEFNLISTASVNDTLRTLADNKYYRYEESSFTYTQNEPIQTVTKDNSNRLSQVRIRYNSLEVEQYFYYNLFEIMRSYGGINFIDKKTDYYWDLISDYIKERDELIQSLFEKEEQLETLSGQDKIYKESEIEYIKTIIESLKAAVGTWTIELGELVEAESDHEDGKYTLFYNIWKENLNGYNIWRANQTPVVPDNNTDNILKSFEAIKKDKQNFWFELKNDFGQFLSEGYYENEIETDPLRLYAQGILYAQDFQTINYDYSGSYIDLSKILGQNITDIFPGDLVSIKLPELDIVKNTPNQLQVTSIIKELRNPSGIGVQLQKIDKTENVLQRILLDLQK